MTNSSQGNLFIVTAASGAGKTSLVKAILKNNPTLELSISFTTRSPRPGEVDGVDYKFINKESFNKMQQKDVFLETAECHGAFYGTSKEIILETIKSGKDIILEIDWQGAFNIKKIYQNAISIFILPPSIIALEERLKKRGQDSEETISKRLSAAKDEMSHLESNVVAVEILADRGLQVKPVFITIDPARDTPEHLADFVANNHPDLVGLTGTGERIAKAARSYKVYYRNQPGDDEEYYLMDHSNFTYLMIPGIGFVDFLHSDTSPQKVADRVACVIRAA